MGNSLKLVWHGVHGDDNLWTAQNAVWSPDKGLTGWSPNHPIGVQSSNAPDLDSSGRVMAYKDVSSNAIHLSGPAQEPPAEFQTTSKPAVDTLRSGEPVLAWRRDDATIAVSWCTNGQWASPEVVGRSTHGPTIAVDRGVNIVVAFKGADDDLLWGGLYRGSWSSVAMRPQAGAMRSAHTPTVFSAPDMGGFVMAWAGVTGDQSIWWSRSSDGQNWETPRQAVPREGAILTEFTPAIVQWDFGWALVWKGVTGDTQLWWSILGDLNGSWEPPVPVDGSDHSNTGPSLGLFEAGTL